MKELFVLGAGASYASAQTPLGKDLVWDYPQDCSLLVPIVGGKPDYTQDGIDNDLEHFFSFCGRIFPELAGELTRFRRSRQENIVYNPPYNMEKKYYLDEILRIAQERSDDKAKRLIKKLIFKHIVGSSYDHSNTLYQSFIKTFGGKSRDKISILSFNFDSLFHEDFNTDVYFDYLIEFDKISQRESYNRKNGIPLIKLSGSFDWGFCPLCKKLTLFFHHMHPEFYDERYCQIGECKGELEPLIIAPHEEIRMELLWEAAVEAINQADKIIVIGYSFPPYDKRVIDAFRSNMKPNVEMEVIEYGNQRQRYNRDNEMEQVNNKFGKLFPSFSGKLKVSLEGFEHYVRTDNSCRC